MVFEMKEFLRSVEKIGSCCGWLGLRKSRGNIWGNVVYRTVVVPMAVVVRGDRYAGACMYFKVVSSLSLPDPTLIVFVAVPIMSWFNLREKLEPPVITRTCSYSPLVGTMYVVLPSAPCRVDNIPAAFIYGRS